MQASAEVERLAKLKASRMKELVFKKRSELEEICRLTHIEPDTSTAPEKASALIDSGPFPVVLIDYLSITRHSLMKIWFLFKCTLKRADIIELFWAGLVDPSELLANIEAQIMKARDEALSRKEVTDRIDKWLSACEEENWLDEYSQVSQELLEISVLFN